MATKTKKKPVRALAKALKKNKTQAKTLKKAVKRPKPTKVVKPKKKLVKAKVIIKKQKPTLKVKPRQAVTLPLKKLPEKKPMKTHLKKVEKKVAIKPVKKVLMKPIKMKKKETQETMIPVEKIVNNIGVDGIEPYIPKAKENYMSAGMREHFRNILQGWKKQLMLEAGRTVQHMQDESTNFPDPTDRATQEEEFNLELRARDRERKLIKKIEEALFCLDEGEYGFCEACGEEIGLRRLEARPTATLCIDCKTLDEIREKQQGN